MVRKIFYKVFGKSYVVHRNFYKVLRTFYKVHRKSQALPGSGHVADSPDGEAFRPRRVPICAAGRA